MPVKRVSLLVAGLLLLLAGLGLLFWHPSTEPEAVAADPASPVSFSVGDFLPYSPVEGLVGASVSVPLPLPSEHAIPGEYTVFFEDAASMAAFLEEAEAAGLTVRGTLPSLLVARIQASGERLSALLKDGMEVDLNYRMGVPTMLHPDLWQSGNLTAFNAGVLEFLGVPSGEARLSWGKGVKIAILDTGWLPHGSLEGTSIREIDLIGGSREGEYAAHGTAVAGLVSSTNPFAPGIAPGSELLAVRVLDGEGRGDAFTLAEAILVAVENGAQVINMSLGGYGDSQVLREAVQYAVSEGVVLVAASGNDGLNQLTYPAAYPSVIGVTAVDASGNRAGFSNFGDGVDVAAPGYQIHALWDDDEYIYFNGTSASAPLVAGMAARILESGLADDPAAVQDLLRAQANDTGLPGDDPQYGAGVLNAERLESLGEPGIFDMALADLYPAIEQSDGTSFPLYVSFQNRGTEFIPTATVEISVNGTPYAYTFSGIDLGDVESVQIPLDESLLEGGFSYSVKAQVKLPETYTDSRPANDAGDITMRREPGGG